MANRTVAVRLVAEVGSYIAGVKNAAAATRDLGSEVAKEAHKNREAWNEVGQGLLAFGAAVGVGVGLAIKRFADFDQAMSHVQAATHETAANMNLLRDAALEAGARTAFSATEAAQGIEALAKAGVSTADILNGGLNGALDLAAAGGLEVGEAAEIAATAMTQFRLSGEKVPHIADLLAAAAGKAQGDVSDMAQALKQAGLVSAQMGLSVEETTGTLAAFASAGLLGSDAGTSFRTMLLRLTNPSMEAAGAMDALGINTYDAQGQFVGMENLAGQLKDRMSELDPATRNAALATIFGSDAIRAANVLYAEGAEGIAEWTANVNDQGYAAETAAIRMDNLRGDIERLGGSLETALIGSASGANGVLREMVQAADAAVSAFSALPGPVQSVVFGAGALVAAVSLAGGAFLVAVPKVAAFNAALATMGPRTQAVGGALKGAASMLAGPWGIALAAGTTALALYGAERSRAQQAVEEFTAAIQADSGALGQNARELAANKLEQAGVYETAQQLGLSLELVTEAALGNTDAMRELRGQIGENVVISNEFWNTINSVAEATAEGQAAAERHTEALGAEGVAAEGTAGAQDELAGATLNASGEIVSQSDAMKELADQTRDLSNQILGLRGAQRDLEAAVDDAAAALAENGRTLDRNTEQGRANEAALDAIADAANDVMQGMLEAGAPISDVSAKMREQRERLVAAATAFGMTTAEANAFADSVLRIPNAKTVQVSAPGAVMAAQHAEILRRQLEAIPSQRTIRIDTIMTTINRVAGQGSVGGITRADGGWIYGPGGPRDDKVNLWASPGEYIVNARSAAQHKDLLEAINANRYASGGWVRGSAVVSSTAGTQPGGPVLETHYHGDFIGYDPREIERVRERRVRDAMAVAGL